VEAFRRDNAVLERELPPLREEAGRLAGLAARLEEQDGRIDGLRQAGGSGDEIRALLIARTQTEAEMQGIRQWISESAEPLRRLVAAGGPAAVSDEPALASERERREALRAELDRILQVAGAGG
jgi:hypothetical protein